MLTPKEFKTDPHCVDGMQLIGEHLLLTCDKKATLFKLTSEMELVWTSDTALHVEAVQTNEAMRLYVLTSREVKGFPWQVIDTIDIYGKSQLVLSSRFLYDSHTMLDLFSNGDHNLMHGDIQDELEGFSVADALFIATK